MGLDAVIYEDENEEGELASKRLGNFQFNSQYYWMVTQSWVK